MRKTSKCLCEDVRHIDVEGFDLIARDLQASAQRVFDNHSIYVEQDANIYDLIDGSLLHLLLVGQVRNIKDDKTLGSIVFGKCPSQTWEGGDGYR